VISAYAALRPEHVPVWNAASLSVALTLMILYRLVRRWIAGKRRKQKVKGLTIGVDIDGVLANQIHGLVPRVRARLGIDLEYEDVIEWRLPLGKSNIAREIEEAFDDSDYISTMPVHTGARDLVDSLYENNVVTLITARPESTKAATQQWLQNHGFSYDQLVNVKEQKKSLYRSAVLVDDYLGNVEEYLRNTSGIAILVEQPWNRTGREHLDEWALAGRLHVVTRLVDIPMIVDGIRKRSAPVS
jgi:5'(3')-deoxyribonucleotidase